jgi:hypothetical protein
MHFATLPRKVLSKALPTQALATPRNEKQMLLFMLLQLFWAYCNTFHALKQAQKLVVAIVRTKVLELSSLSINGSNRLACFGYRIGYELFVFADPLLHQHIFWHARWDKST